MALAVGQTFGGYHIVSQLGAGGMGTVYRAHDSNLARDVALKVLPAHLLTDEDSRRRFEREALVIARLEHPGIVPVHAFGITDHIPWMSLRLVSGGTLSDVLSGRAAIAADPLRVLTAIAEALEFAHSQGVIHRDLKPQNILLGRSGEVYLADFGIARLLAATTNLTATGTVIGTPQYMAPEQANGEPLTAACDVYALAVIAYQWLCRCLPFDGDTPISVLYKQVHSEVPLEPMQGLSPALRQALLQGLAKRPEDRPSTPTRFVDALGPSLRSPAPQQRRDTGAAADPAGTPTLAPAAESPTDARGNIRHPKPLPATDRPGAPALLRGGWAAGLLLLLLVGWATTYFVRSLWTTSRLDAQPESPASQGAEGHAKLGAAAAAASSTSSGAMDPSVQRSPSMAAPVPAEEGASPSSDGGRSSASPPAAPKRSDVAEAGSKQTGVVSSMESAGQESFASSESADPIRTCDLLAADRDDVDLPPGITGIESIADIDGPSAVAACRIAAESSSNARLWYQYGRALQGAGDTPGALTWLRKAGGAGHVLAMALLGILIDEPSESEHWLRLAGDAGDTHSMFRLGFMYENGIGVRRDISESQRWYERAANSGDETSMRALAGNFHRGDGEWKKDEVVAAGWYQKAADAGHAWAMTTLGEMYAKGAGVKKDDAEAMRLYLKAVATGDADAMADLGAKYMDGSYGITRDKKEGVRWLRKAAEAGSIAGMEDLSWALERGYGVASDAAEAALWQRRAEAAQAAIDQRLGLKRTANGGASESLSTSGQ